MVTTYLIFVNFDHFFINLLAAFRNYQLIYELLTITVI